jgi:hypothetical protein
MTINLFEQDVTTIERASKSAIKPINVLDKFGYFMTQEFDSKLTNKQVQFITEERNKCCPDRKEFFNLSFFLYLLACSP